MTLSEELHWRGFVNQTTFSSSTELDGDPITFYWGVDPSAPSMTIGNLAAAMMVRHFINYGHKAILLVGGATGMIGDPDGKAEERSLKTLDELTANKQGITAQYQRIFAGKEFEIVDNYDWFKDMNYLHFLRDVGKHVPMRQMLAREFVQSRLGETGSGISYAEFSYVLIQAYDFLQLHRDKGVTLQVSGSDQWGNCIAGVDLIRRVTGNEAHVWSTPLVINKATGKKFGKTEDGAIWLDPNLTSPYAFYQFWLNADDEGVADYLKIYTLLKQEEVIELIEDQKQRPGDRPAQKLLAWEVTALVHGQQAAESVVRVTDVLFSGGDYNKLSEEDFSQLKTQLPTVSAQLQVTTLVDVLVQAGLAASNSEARRFLADSAVYINGVQFSMDKQTFDEHDVIHGHAVIRRGKNKQAVVVLNT